MKLLALVKVGIPESCQPLTSPIEQLPVANRALAQWRLERLQASGIELSSTASTAGSAQLWMPDTAWLCQADIEKLAGCTTPTVLRSSDGAALAWSGAGPEVPSTGCQLVAEPESLLIRYGWDLLEINSQLVGALTDNRLEGTVSARAELRGWVWLGEGSELLPGVFVEGNVVIGRNCKVGPNCYLRGNTAIGDNCHIGQAVEIKNSIIMSGTSIGHLSYCGDSVIGQRVNFGAGTITANLRHDGRNHRSLDAATGQLVDSGRRKLGTIVGDDVHTGIHTSIYPGRKFWPHTWTRPGTVVDRDVMPGEPSAAKAAAGGSCRCSGGSEACGR